jgi:hypothetical protein
MRSWELNPRLNKHGLESLFSGLFCVKGNLTSQNRRLGAPKLGGQMQKVR